MATTNIFNAPLDSLPYFDKDLDERAGEQDPDDLTTSDHSHAPSTLLELRPQLNSLIAVELRSLLPTKSTPTPTNLSHLPPPRPLPSSPFLASELSRVESKKPIPASEGLDTARYSLPAPTGKKATSLPAWEAAHSSSLAQMEHQRLRALNGSLLQSLGGNAWRVQNFALENTVERVEKEGERVKKDVEDVNRERKRQQEQGGEILNRLEKKWTELVSGNMQLEIGCMALEMEVAQLQARRDELAARLGHGQTA